MKLKQLFIILFFLLVLNSLVSNGNTLAGLLLVRPHADYVVVACHGYHRDKEDIWRVSQLFKEQTILFFDFHSHGSSTGKFTSIGYHEQKDILSAIAFLKHN